MGRNLADSGQQAASAARHLPSASLGHYASLSLVVKGGNPRSEGRGQKKLEADGSKLKGKTGDKRRLRISD